MKKPFIIAVANQKGGVGKTTTAAALSVGLQNLGYKVLAVDVDPQANLTSTLGVDEKTAAASPNLFTVIEGLDTMAEAITKTSSGVDLVPSYIGLAHSERSMNMEFGRERILKRLLEPLMGDYDVLVLDSPPSLGIFAYNVLAMCDTVLSPIQCEPFALDGLALLIDTLDDLRDAGLNPNCQLGGAVLTMYDGRRNIDKRVVEALREALEALAFQTVIPRDVRLVEMTERGDVSALNGASAAAVAYRELVKEVASRWLTSLKPV